MSNNAINVRQQFLDSTGTPRANGYVYFYQNRTTTLATIYSDELLSVPQSNPYRLNANGEIEGDVKYSGKMTVVATNSDGSDPISDDDVEAAAGSEFAAYAGQFQTVENSPADMTVVVKAGKVMNGETLVSVANQATAVITAPVTNPRIDRIVIDKLTGVYSIVAGSESATPTAPAIPVGKMPSAQIALSTSTTTITDSLITDERISGSVEPSNINTTETLSNKTIGDTNTINAQTDAFTVDDFTDGTKQIDFSLSGATTGTKTTIVSSQTANRSLTLPNTTDTLVGKATTDTLTNKTIGDTNTINAQTDAFTIDDATTATKQVDFDVSGATASTKTTLDFNQTANRTITIPNATDTLVGKATTDTLTNKTIGDTNTINAQDDAFTINDAADATLQIDFNVAGTTGTKTTVTSSQTTNRTVVLPNRDITLESGYITSNTDCTLVGINALSSNTTGNDNTAVGFNSLTSNTTGINNSALGSNSLDAITTGSDCTAIGYNSLTSNTASRNTAVGSGSLASNTTGSENTAAGYNSLSSNVTGSGNSALGWNSLSSNTSSANSALGWNSLSSNTSGTSNTAIGYNSLSSNTTGSNNTSVGQASLVFNVTGARNCALGNSSLSANTASDNSAYGYNSLNANTTGANNSALGAGSLASNTTASNNCAVGYNSLTANTTGTANVAVGYSALDANTTANSSTAVGFNALTASTGTQNTAIGSGAGSSTTTGTNVTLVGYNAQATAATTSNEITLGDANVTTLRCATTTITAISDERDKENIQDLEQGLDFINAVRAVSYYWNMRGADRRGPDTGCTAQQLQEVQRQFGTIPGLVHDENPDRLEVGYGKLIPVMIKAIQELSAKVEELELALQNK